MRQALWFGNVALLIALIAFAWPLVVSFVVGNIAVTLWLYGFAMLLDAALFVWWLVLAIRYSRRAAGGELFTIPMVAPLTGTWSRKP